MKEENVNDTLDATAIEKRFKYALRLARKAGRLALGRFRSSTLRIDEKGPQDLVTEADRAVENLLLLALSRAFPDDAFVCEESGTKGNLDAAGAVWVIDPIDGTSNYARGIDLWAVSIALVVGGRLAAGIVYRPCTGEMFAALAGHGATLNGKPIRVSSTRSLDKARVAVGFSYRRPTQTYIQALEALFDAGCEHARLGSAALCMAFVADGRYDGYWEAHVNSWDVLGGLCIVSEAGGLANDFLAGNGLRVGNSILAASPVLFTGLSERLGRVGTGDSRS